MPRASCRCGQPLTFPTTGSGHVVCPKCGARVKLRRESMPGAATPDPYIRFLCPCGRRLKVSAADPPDHGKCPDCGRVVPVPLESTVGPGRGDPEAPTADMLPADRERLDDWIRSHKGKTSEVHHVVLNVTSSAGLPPTGSTAEGPIEPMKTERGLRVCPACGKPVHLAATACLHCGSPVPKK